MKINDIKGKSKILMRKKHLRSSNDDEIITKEQKKGIKDLKENLLPAKFNEKEKNKGKVSDFFQNELGDKLFNEDTNTS